MQKFCFVLLLIIYKSYFSIPIVLFYKKLCHTFEMLVNVNSLAIFKIVQSMNCVNFLFDSQNYYVLVFCVKTRNTPHEGTFPKVF